MGEDWFRTPLFLQTKTNWCIVSYLLWHIWRTYVTQCYVNKTNTLIIQYNLLWHSIMAQQCNHFHFYKIVTFNASKGPFRKHYWRIWEECPDFTIHRRGGGGGFFKSSVGGPRFCQVLIINNTKIAQIRPLKSYWGVTKNIYVEGGGGFPDSSNTQMGHPDSANSQRGAPRFCKFSEGGGCPDYAGENRKAYTPHPQWYFLNSS